MWQFARVKAINSIRLARMGHQAPPPQIAKRRGAGESSQRHQRSMTYLGLRVTCVRTVPALPGLLPAREPGRAPLPPVPPSRSPPDPRPSPRAGPTASVRPPCTPRPSPRTRRPAPASKDATLPLLERLFFLCIFSRNLDEFFEIRVSGLKERLALGLLR